MKTTIKGHPVKANSFPSTHISFSENTDSASFSQNVKCLFLNYLQVYSFNTFDLLKGTIAVPVLTINTIKFISHTYFHCKCCWIYPWTLTYTISNPGTSVHDTHLTKTSAITKWGKRKLGQPYMFLLSHFIDLKKSMCTNTFSHFHRLMHLPWIIMLRKLYKQPKWFSQSSVFIMFCSFTAIFKTSLRLSPPKEQLLNLFLFSLLFIFIFF